MGLTNLIYSLSYVLCRKNRIGRVIMISLILGMVNMGMSEGKNIRKLNLAHGSYKLCFLNLGAWKPGFHDKVLEDRGPVGVGKYFGSCTYTIYVYNYTINSNKEEWEGQEHAGPRHPCYPDDQNFWFKWRLRECQKCTTLSLCKQALEALLRGICPQRPSKTLLPLWTQCGKLIRLDKLPSGWIGQCALSVPTTSSQARQALPTATISIQNQGKCSKGWNVKPYNLKRIKLEVALEVF